MPREDFLLSLSTRDLQRAFTPLSLYKDQQIQLKKKLVNPTLQRSFKIYSREKIQELFRSPLLNLRSASINLISHFCDSLRVVQIPFSVKIKSPSLIHRV
jgi:hypothetical protein